MWFYFGFGLVWFTVFLLDWFGFEHPSFTNIIVSYLLEREREIY